MRIRLIGLALLSAGVLFISVPSSASDRLPLKDGPIMTAKEAAALMTTAKTSKDHIKLAQYFSEEAKQFEADAREHDEMMAAYRKALYPRNSKTPSTAGTIVHCESLARSDREMARALRATAAAHREMAREAGTE